VAKSEADVASTDLINLTMMQRVSEVPALLLWGTRDTFLGRELVQPTLDLCNDARVVFLEEATLAHEEPDKVNTLLTEFLSLPGNASFTAGR
jgi:pimeloyl-ACP methyl ester carboxylesterase